MRSSMLGVWGACVYLLLGCGSSSADFFDAPGARVTSSAGSATSSAGGTGVAGSIANAGGASSSGPSSSGSGPSAPCSPVKDLTGGSSGPFGSTGDECFRVTSTISGWGCSNFDGRSIKVNGTEVMCGQVPLPAAIDGAYYFEVSSGMFDYASFYWF